jgi:hypothetical protein
MKTWPRSSPSSTRAPRDKHILAGNRTWVACKNYSNSLYCTNAIRNIYRTKQFETNYWSIPTVLPVLISGPEPFWPDLIQVNLLGSGSYIVYVPETHIMYFIQRCWFLKCSEEIHYVPIGAGDMWYYVPVDDGWEEVLGCNVYIMSQYWSTGM